MAPNLTLPPEGAGQREHGLRNVFNGQHYVVMTETPWRWMPHDLPSWPWVTSTDLVEIWSRERRAELRL